MPDLPAPPSNQHNNPDLLVWSLFCLDGSQRWVDVEEVYLKAFELAPARLGWRTRPDIPDYKKCAKALQEVEDPRRTRHPGLFEKAGQYRRRLTALGVRWCEQNQRELGALYGTGSVPSAVGQDDGRRVRAIVQSGPFIVWRESRQLSSALWELAEIFRCMPDSSPSTWNSRLDEHLVAARRNNQSDVVDFIEEVRAVVGRPK